MNNSIYNYSQFLQYVDLSDTPERIFFSDVKEGNILYEIVEKAQDFQILERRVKWLKHKGKKTHFTLIPMEGMKDCTYCPYSNRQYAMSKQFNPIFVSKNKAISFMSEKLEQDRDYLMSRLTSVSRKRALLQYYIEGRMISTTTRRSRRPMFYSSPLF